MLPLSQRSDGKANRTVTAGWFPSGDRNETKPASASTLSSFIVAARLLLPLSGSGGGEGGLSRQRCLFDPRSWVHNYFPCRPSLPPSLPLSRMRLLNDHSLVSLTSRDYKRSIYQNERVFQPKPTRVFPISRIRISRRSFPPIAYCGRDDKRLSYPNEPFLQQKSHQRFPNIEGSQRSLPPIAHVRRAIPNVYQNERIFQ